MLAGLFKNSLVTAVVPGTKNIKAGESPISHPMFVGMPSCPTCLSNRVILEETITRLMDDDTVYVAFDI